MIFLLNVSKPTSLNALNVAITDPRALLAELVNISTGIFYNVMYIYIYILYFLLIGKYCLYETITNE